MKKERKEKAEKIYLKKGFYALNDIYYDIFLSSNGQHYFSFINNKGRTVLLNGDIKGFNNLAEAEQVIEEVLKYAKQKNRFEIKTAKDGKFFFNLYNDKGEKIAKSFFFRKKEDIEYSRDEFIKGIPSKKVGPSSIPRTLESTQIKEANIIPISNKVSNNTINEIRETSLNEKYAEEKKLLENKRIAEKKKEEEKRKRLEIKEKKEKERILLLSNNKEKRKEARLKKEEERKKAIQIHASRDPMKDDDLFDGCFRWLWIILALILLAFILLYFKGCFEKNDGSANSLNPSGMTIDSTDSKEDGSIKNIDSTLSISADDNTNSNQGILSTNENNNSENSNEEAIVNNSNSNGVLSDVYENSIQKIASCNCGSKAVVFDIPSSEPKKINKLGTNPQFENSHGLSSADFLEDLKYRYKNSSWDRSYLNYLYKTMGYDGFQDARSSQVSQEKLKSGVNGILGFGSYSGYAYSELDLVGKDLEVFRIEAANGCHINFMKTCGNLFFVCQ